MDAFIVSAIIKKGLTSKSFRKTLEHAAFLISTPSTYKNYDKSRTNILADNSMTDNSLVADNSENSMIADNSDTYKVSDNSDNSDTIYSNTDNSSNITVNNIKVTNVKSKSKMEHEEEEETEEDEYQNKNKANKISNMTFLLMLIINSYAAFLSWECNTHKEYPILLKIVFSFFAFIFGTIYLLYYILFKFDDCNKFSHNY